MTQGRKNFAICLIGAGAFILAGGCGDDGPGVTVGNAPTLEISQGGQPVGPNGIVAISPAALAAGEVGSVAEFRIVNTGNATLDITSIQIDSTPPGAFWLADLPEDGQDPALPLRIDPQDRMDNEHPRTVFLYVMFERPPAGVEPSGTITFRSNSVREGVRQENYPIRLQVERAQPRLQVSPSQVDFGNVTSGGSQQRSISLLNVGAEELVIDGFILAGHPSFSFVVGAQVWPVSPETSSLGIDLEEPLVVAPGSAISVASLFQPTGPEPAQGSLILFSNDPQSPQGTVVPLQGNVGGPCIAVTPRTVDFGGKLVGRQARVDVDITSCGDSPLDISEIVLTSGSDPEFSLALETLPGVAGGGTVGAIGQADPSVILAPNQTGRFQVVYLPSQISPLDGEGMPVRDTAVIRIRSNAFVSELNVEVRGFGVEVECPTAVIVVQEGEEVIPQTKLHLIGSQSYAASGSIVQYRWEVNQPPGSQSVFVPSAVAPDPTFETNVAGTYVFRLTVVDSGGTESCVPAETTVFVNPDRAIHIELTWHTPNDPDETAEGPGAGSDLDLHFAHPFASGGYDGDGDGRPDPWFDGQFDCFWFNPRPIWGSLDPTVDDNPSLDRDDTDGAGPENITLNLPEAGMTYRIGVHYWDDHGYGPSFATVRVYLFSNQVFEMSGVEMVRHDMWWVAGLHWPSGVVDLEQVCAGTNTECTSDAQCGGGSCGFKVTPNYVHPFFPASP